MKVRIVLAVCALLLVPTLAFAASGPKATGGGRAVSSSEFTFAFTAQGTPDEAKGMVNYVNQTTDVRYRGTVTCYTQTANTASFSGIVTNAEGTTNGFFVWNVIDRGEGASTTAPGDALRARTVQQEPDCTNTNTAFPGLVIAGNIQVHPPE